MREVLFRAKRIDNGEWVYGDLVINRPSETYRIIEDFALMGQMSNSNYEFAGLIHLINPKTVGQYIGIKDKNGNKIFEGDKVSDPGGNTGTIVWNQDDCSFSVDWGDHGLESLYLDDAKVFEKIKKL